MAVQPTVLLFFLFVPIRMDENYNLLPHGVNFQDAIFPDTQENRRMFSSLFQFSNCSQGQQLATFSSDWEIQEDNRVRIVPVSQRNNRIATSCLNFVTKGVKSILPEAQTFPIPLAFKQTDKQTSYKLTRFLRLY